ncbi:methyltransferase domain-containing protein [Nocardia sp. ET3-3]|uniref:Methyltransferase domain-containing protein n=1 Tax=Nocardia terrae TaxID=2675851 RepID=A0A7K1V001_9NOCA|nr:class I SAM-dependent methyltransferase [Nocardia terrae]MVU79970.1 methyltransferase domain-containing protein [Nocardia terrae]
MSDQHEHWQRTYRANPGMYGEQPSDPAVYAARLFRDRGALDVLELGAGHGRDAIHLARQGFRVTASDFSAEALAQLRERAEAEGLGDQVRTLEHDVRQPIPLPYRSVDAVYAHMLLCMNLSTQEIRDLVGEIHRVLKPGGVLVYTVRNTEDAHFGTGTALGDDIYEHGGFAVHFFSPELVDILATGWELRERQSFEEGELPRRLWRVTQELPRH